jgi:hypothetical protein
MEKQKEKQSMGKKEKHFSRIPTCMGKIEHHGQNRAQAKSSASKIK